MHVCITFRLHPPVVEPVLSFERAIHVPWCWIWFRYPSVIVAFLLMTSGKLVNLKLVW
jgi:hypothetical protein